VKPPQDWNDYNSNNHTDGMSLTATMTGGGTTTAPLAFNVHVAGAADTPTVTVSAVTGSQNDGSGAAGNWIPLTITPAHIDVTGTETISAITVTGMPAGATLSAGTHNDDGSWTLTTDQLSGLSVLPPAHSAGDFTLTVTSTSLEQGANVVAGHATATSAPASLKVTVTGFAEAPILGESTPAVGNEDTRINVNLATTLPDSHESYTGMTLTNVPANAVFFAASDGATRLGTFDTATSAWSFTPAEIATIKTTGLFIQPPPNYSDWNTAGNSTGMQLHASISATMSDPDTGVVSTVTTNQILGVEVKSVADAPTVTAAAAAGPHLESAPIALTIAPHLTDTDGSETISAITITGVPTGGSLNHGHDNGGGSWTLTSDDLTGLTLTPPQYSKETITLHVTATSTETPVTGTGDTHVAVSSATSTVADVTISITAVANTPTLSVSGVLGNEDSWIPLSITATTPDSSGSETVSVNITGLPSGAVLNHGTYDAASQSWTVSQSDLTTLKVLPPEDNNSDFTIQVTATTHEMSNGATTTSAAQSEAVIVQGVAEAPSLTQTAQSLGTEDTRINLNLAGALADPNEALSLTLSGIPAGSQFFFAASGANTSIGTDNHDGTWSFSSADMAQIKASGHGLYLQPPTDWSDWSGSSHTATNIPAGAHFYADAAGTVAIGHDNGDGSWTFAAADMAVIDTTGHGLFMQSGGSGVAAVSPSAFVWNEWTPGQGGIAVTAKLTSTDTDNDANTPVHINHADTTINFTVHVSGVADVPLGLPTGDFVATALEDNNNTRTGALVDPGFGVLAPKDADGSEHLSVVVSGLPAGTHLVFADGTSTDFIVPVADGKWSIDSQYLPQLRLAVGQDFNTPDPNAPITFHADVVTTEVDGSVHVEPRTVDVTVTPVTDAAHISFTHGGSAVWGGSEDTQINIGLGVSAGGVGESVVSTAIDLSAAPAGTHLFYDGAQVSLTNGSFTVPSGYDLAKFAVQAPSNWSDWSSDNRNTGLPVTVSVTTQDHNAPTQVTSQTLHLHVNGVGDAPTLSAFSGTSLDLSSNTSYTFDPASNGTSSHAVLTDTDGSEKLWMVVDGVPSGAVLVTGTGVAIGINEGGGHWMVSSADFATAGNSGGLGIKFDQPATSSGSANITVYALSTEQNTGSTAQSAGQTFTLGWSNGTTASDPVMPTVTVNGVNSGLSTPVSGTEDTGIAISIGGFAGQTATLVIDNSSLLVSGGGRASIAGATYDPIHDTWEVPITAIGDGVAHITVTPPGNWNSTLAGQLTLTGHVVVTDQTTGHFTSQNLSVPITVSAVTDAAHIGAGANGQYTYVNGQEDHAIGLNLTVAAGGINETVNSVTLDLSSAPSGTHLNYDGVAVTLTAGNTYTVPNGADLTKFSVTPPSNWSDWSDGGAGIPVKVSVVSQDHTATALTTQQTLTVHVTGVTDGAIITVPGVLGGDGVTHVVTGTENQWISLNGIGVTQQDSDGSEGMSIILTNVPDGAVLNHGFNNGDGSWRLASTDLGNLKILMPRDYNGHAVGHDGTLNINVEALTWERDGSDGLKTSLGSFQVDLNAVAETPVVSVTPAHGKEGAAISLDIAASVHHALGSDHISAITIAGVPAGALLNHGTHNTDGTWTLSANDLSGLTLTPVQYSKDSLALTVTATASETDAISGHVSTASSSATLAVQIDAVADKPTVTVSNVSGNEGYWISIGSSISAHVTDTSGTESITSVTISGMPSGAWLNHGVYDATANTWTVASSDLADLMVAPPSYDARDFTLSVAATSTEQSNGDSALGNAVPMKVTVNATASAAIVGQSGAASGVEDTRINLHLSQTIGDPNEVNSATMVVSGVPSGSQFYSAATGATPLGHDNGDGTWTFSGSELTTVRASGLFVQPPANWSDWSSSGHTAGMQLTATVTTTNTDPDTGVSHTATAATSFAVHVDGVADAPTVTVSAASGSEDSVIALNISSALTDNTGSEFVSAYTISGVPTGATLNHGHDNGNGSWTLQPGEVAGLTITPSSHDAQDFNLTVTATSQDWQNSSNATSSGTTLHVVVDAVAHTPTITQSAAASGNEDTRINLNLGESLAATVTNETLTLTVSGVPTGSHFYAAGSGDCPIGVDNNNGTWSFSATDVAQMQGGGLYVLPPQDWNDYVTPGNTTGMQLTATLTSSTAADPNSGNVATATSSQSFTVHVASVADAPTVTVTPAQGDEDVAISLNIATAFGSLTHTESINQVTITGVPTGASLNHGTHNTDGSWTLTTGDLADLTVTPALHDASDFTLTVTANAAEQGGNVAAGGLNALSAPLSLTVTVDAAAHTPTITHTIAASGTEDTRINLNLGESLAATVTNETLSMTVTGVPSGSHFYNAATGGVAVGTDNNDGSWTFSATDVANMQGGGHNLYVLPPTNWNDYSSANQAGMALTATLTSTTAADPNSHVAASASASQSFTVHVTGVADTPTVTVAAARGNEDSAIALNITPLLAPGVDTETISSITISGMPTGATLNHGTVSGGVWTVHTGDLADLTVTPPSHSAANFTLTVNAVSTELGNTSSSATSATASLLVTVDAHAHTPVLVQTTTAAGTEDSRINLNLSETLASGVTNETLGMTITGVPTGSHFYADAGGTVAIGHDNLDGSWSFTSADITSMHASGHNVYVQPPTNWNDYDSAGQSGLHLGVTLTSSTAADPESGLISTATATQSLTVHVTGVADMPSVQVGEVEATAGTAIDMSQVIHSALTDTTGSESLSITLTGTPGDAQFNHGTHNANGSWTMTAGDLSSLTMTTGSGDSGSYTIGVSSTSTDVLSGSHATDSHSLTLNLVNSATDTLNFSNLPAVPANGAELGEFVFGGLNGVHNVSVYGANSGALHFDINGVDHAIAAGVHGSVQADGIHTLNNDGSQTVTPIDHTGFIDANQHIHVDLTFDNHAVLHLAGLDKITF
jgi:hypothetical protein